LRGTGIINAIIGVGEAYRFEQNHALQVTRIALRLFDELQPLHGMGNTERIWLRAAAMLHDVGKAQDPKEHHKVAQEIIIRSAKLPFRAEERVIIGLIARYHRGPLPQNDHKYFEDLDTEGRRYVRKLASLLRLADGLDKGHSDLVGGLQCEIRRRRVHIRLVSRNPLSIDAALSKADLFEHVFQKKAVLHTAVVKGTPNAIHRVGEPRQHPDSALDLDLGPAYADAN
jgi:exopolyphosphatase/guanosine-5'-triphosphate,3'-diphosphate pyrophosphatase